MRGFPTKILYVSPPPQYLSYTWCVHHRLQIQPVEVTTVINRVSASSNYEPGELKYWTWRFGVAKPAAGAVEFHRNRP